MSRLLIVGSYDAERWGGLRSMVRIASILRKTGVDAQFVSIAGWTKGTIREEMARLAPDHVLAKDAVATIRVKEAASTMPVDYYPSAVQLGLVLGNLGIGARKLADALSRGPHIAALASDSLQSQAISLSDRVIPHSDQTDRLLRMLFPNYAEKATEVIWTSLIREAEPYPRDAIARRIRFLFCATDWAVRWKNAAFLPPWSALGPERLQVVGDGSPLAPAFNLGHLPSEALRQTFRDANVVLIPSRYDAAPNVAVEAADAGCQLLISRDVGSASLFRDENLLGLEAPFATWRDRAEALAETYKTVSLPDGRAELAKLLRLYAD